MLRVAALVVLLAPMRLSGQADTPITFVGFGVVHVGMKPEEASRRLGEPLLPKEGRVVNEGCYHVHPASQPTLEFMVENGRIVRAETSDKRYRTWSGVRVGDTEETARAKYGPRCELMGHQYDPAGHYLVIRSADKASALVLETDGKTVTYIRAGRQPAAEYVEGCL
jgi:hypothetical protein